MELNEPEAGGDLFDLWEPVAALVQRWQMLERAEVKGGSIKITDGNIVIEAGGGIPVPCTLVINGALAAGTALFKERPAQLA